jgi:ribulose-5-phosphate 4-epimerase/fuculose-1-phosphate aldolase
MSVQLVSGADMVAQGVRNRVSDAEWTARVDLAALYRVVHYFRLTDTIYTHISMRIPGPEEAFLINSFGLMYDEICASNLVKVNVSGDILDDPVGLGINRAGFVIHGAIHGARHDVNSVLHTHTRAGIAVSAQKGGLRPISQHAAFLAGRVSYHDFEGIAVNLDEQQRLIADLGSKYAMILNNHGLLTAGRTPGETIKLMLTLERACDAQIAAFSGGIEVVEISSAAQQSTTNTVDELDGNFARDWAAMLRLAHRTAPGFDQ